MFDGQTLPTLRIPYVVNLSQNILAIVSGGRYFGLCVMVISHQDSV